MSDRRWSWDAGEHPDVVGVLASPVTDLTWCDRLEHAPTDPTVGKVMCVCAAAAIARAVLAAHQDGTSRAFDALEVLERWIAEPTGERFGRICSLISDDAELPDLDPHGVVWWALRTATSSVGNFEAGWALESTCGAAEDAGFTPEQLRAIAEQEITSRIITS